MKNALKLATHAIICIMIALLFENELGDSWKAMAYGIAAAMLAIVCAFTRWYAKKFIFFIGSHILISACCIGIMPLVGMNMWHSVIWIMPVIYSIILRLVPQMEQHEEPSYLYIGFLVVVHCLVSIIDGLTFATKVSLWAIILLFLLKLLNENLNSIEQFLELHSLVNKPDVKKIVHINTKISLAYTGVLGVFLGALCLISMEKIKEIIRGAIGNFIRFVFSLFSLKEKVKLENENENFQQMLPDIMEQNEQEISRSTEVIGDILFFIIAACLVAGILFIIFRAVVIAYRHFYNRTIKQEEDRVVEKISKKEKVRIKSKKKIFERKENTPSKKIRKIYKKCLTKLGAKRIKRFSFMTPEEQMVLLKEQGTDDNTIKEIRNIYEKARYGGKIITDKEESDFTNLTLNIHYGNLNK